MQRRREHTVWTSWNGSRISYNVIALILGIIGMSLVITRSTSNKSKQTRDEVVYCCRLRRVWRWASEDWPWAQKWRGAGRLYLWSSEICCDANREHTTTYSYAVIKPRRPDMLSDAYIGNDIQHDHDDARRHITQCEDNRESRHTGESKHQIRLTRCNPCIRMNLLLTKRFCPI
jgi:hypothetical protein